MATSTVLNFLIGGTNKGKYPAVCGAEQTVNMYKCTNGKAVFMESMPGIKMLSQVGGKCRGVWVSTRGLKAESSTEDLFAAMGNKLYRVKPDGSCTPIITLAANGRRVIFAEAGGPRAILLVCDGSALYAYFLEDGTVHQVNMPNAVEGDGHTVRPTHVCVVNGVIVVNDESSGYAYYSIPYPISADTREVFDLDPNGGVQYEGDGITVKKKTVNSWDWCFLDDYGVQQFMNSESNSDSINGLASIGNALYLFGPKSVEIYTYAGEEYATWSRQYFSATGEFGLEAPDSLCCVGRSIYFVSTGRQFGKTVMRVTGTNFERVSEDWLDERIGGNTDSAYGFGYGVNEHSFYILQVPEIKQTWTFDSATSEWHERRSRSPYSALETRWRVGGVAFFRSRFYAFTEDGMVAQFGDYWYEDYADGNKSVVVRHRQGPVFTSDLRPFIIEDLTLECNVGCFKDYEGRPRVLLECSKDGGMTFGNIRSSSFGLTGQYGHRVRFLNLGRNRLCVLRVTFSEPMDFVLTNCSIRAGATGAQI